MRDNVKERREVALPGRKPATPKKNVEGNVTKGSRRALG